MPFEKNSAFKEEKNAQKQSSKKLPKSRARKTIKPTPKLMTNSRNKALIIQLAIILDHN